jgi:hypothetical protein
MNQACEYRRDEHRVHLLIYHLIWCPRRRKLVLVGVSRQQLIGGKWRRCSTLPARKEGFCRESWNRAASSGNGELVCCMVGEARN